MVDLSLIGETIITAVLCSAMFALGVYIRRTANRQISKYSTASVGSSQTASEESSSVHESHEHIQFSLSHYRLRYILGSLLLWYFSIVFVLNIVLFIIKTFH